MNEEFFIPPHLRPPLRKGRRPIRKKDLDFEQLEIFRRLDPEQQEAYRRLITRFGEKKIRKNKSPVNGLSGSGFKEWLSRVLGIKPKSKPESPSTPPPDPSSHFSENELMEMLGYKNEKKEKNKPASEESGGKKKRKRRNIQ